MLTNQANLYLMSFNDTRFMNLRCYCERRMDESTSNCVYNGSTRNDYFILAAEHVCRALHSCFVTLIWNMRQVSVHK